MFNAVLIFILACLWIFWVVLLIASLFNGVVACTVFGISLTLNIRRLMCQGSGSSLQ